MVVSVETLLYVVFTVAFILWLSTLTWQWCKGYDRTSRFVRFLTEMVLLAIEIGILTVKLLNGESYGMNIFLCYVILANAVVSALKLNDD